MRIAISIPRKMFEAGERLARQRGISRSELYTNALSANVGIHRAAAITARLDALYGNQHSRLDPGLARAQHNLLADEVW